MSQLTFRLPPNPSGAAFNPPIKVRKQNLTVLAETTASDSVTVEQPGIYLASALLPDGMELTGSVAVSKDALASEPEIAVELAPDPDSLRIHPVSQEQASTRGILPDFEAGLEMGGTDLRRYWIQPESNDPDGGERFGFGGFRGGNAFRGGLEGMGPEENGSKLTGAVLLRAFSGSGWGKFEAMPEGWGTAVPMAQGVVRIRILNSQARLIQLLQEGKRSINIMVPSGESDACWLEVGVQPDGSATLIAHLENTAADALLLYRASGQVRQAELVSQTRALDAENLLSAKMRAPISAAVGAYALLRFGNLERLHSDWTQNLRNWFGWMPDGSAIRGEHLARLGQHAEALDCFLDLETRGLPFFSPGLSYAIDRLRLYASIGPTSFNAEKLQRAGKLMEKLCAYSGLTNFDEILMTFTGLDPNRPDVEKLTQDPLQFDGLDATPYLGSGPLLHG